MSVSWDEFVATHGAAVLTSQTDVGFKEQEDGELHGGYAVVHIERIGRNIVTVKSHAYMHDAVGLPQTTRNNTANSDKSTIRVVVLAEVDP